jgi:hypothetical protein
LDFVAGLVTVEDQRDERQRRGEADRQHATDKRQGQTDECRLPRPQHHGERGKAVAVRDGEEMINRFGFLFELFYYL